MAFHQGQGGSLLEIRSQCLLSCLQPRAFPFHFSTSSVCFIKMFVFNINLAKKKASKTLFHCNNIVMFLNWWYTFVMWGKNNSLMALPCLTFHRLFIILYTFIKRCQKMFIFPCDNMYMNSHGTLIFLMPGVPLWACSRIVLWNAVVRQKMMFNSWSSLTNCHYSVVLHCFWLFWLRRKMPEEPKCARKRLLSVFCLRSGGVESENAHSCILTHSASQQNSLSLVHFLQTELLYWEHCNVINAHIASSVTWQIPPTAANN